MKLQASRSFEYVAEWNDEFLALFPHRFDYIWAEHTTPDETIAWKTESRHPLSDRLIRQSSYFYGVRFGGQTRYCLLDIDIGSPYHPDQDPFAIARIAGALEALGLVSYVACTSSYSGGLHLYFPCQEAQSSWQLAIALATLLENAGYKLKPGQLEVFPDPKPYSVNGQLSLFNAHRLPMQAGSYLINENFQPIWGTQQSFVQQWSYAQQRNEIDRTTLRNILKQAKRHHYQVSNKADKFINDLNAEIELGWTGYGQTNRLLGRITMRTYIFNHILKGGEPLSGKALVAKVVEIARSLPGYFEYCRHQHEIEHRCEEWARCIENSHYFHYSDRQGKFKSKIENPDLEMAIEQVPTWNEQQSAGARERIKNAIATLLETNSLPSGATARFRALLKYGIGGSSLYRHRDLWHPQHLTEMPINFPIEQTELAQLQENFSSLFPLDGGDSTDSQASSDFAQPVQPSGSNHCDRKHRKVVKSAEVDYRSLQPALFDIQAWLEISQEAVNIAKAVKQRIKAEATQGEQVARMQQFLESGDPILIAEVWVWVQVNSGALELDRVDLSEINLPIQQSFEGS